MERVVGVKMGDAVERTKDAFEAFSKLECAYIGLVKRNSCACTFRFRDQIRATDV